MTFEAKVINGRIELPPGVALPDGTSVTVEATRASHTIADLLPLLGTWEGDDAEEIIEEVYRYRSHSPARLPFDT